MVEDLGISTTRWARRAADSFLVLAVILLLAAAAIGAPWVYGDPSESVEGNRWPVAEVVLGLMSAPVLVGLVASLAAARPTRRAVVARIALAIGAVVLAVGAVGVGHALRPAPFTG